MAKASKSAPRPCPIGKHQMPDGKCMKDSAMKKSPSYKPGGPPIRRSSGY